ncbi:MAG: phosphate ABC transporter substrate-binding protein [Methanomassiliicoccaceae archaeon]|nr:phosphate ABC transporter substrate-binding protein [Methanomassiliicoccaceae archaeon]
MENKTLIVAAVLVVAVIFVAGAFVLLPKDNESSATINVAGSTTVQPIMANFQEIYEKQHKNVTINITAQGSGTAAPALRNGTADIGMLSRDLNSGESDLRPLIIAGDAVVIVVDKNSGVTNLTLEQLAKIYSGEYTNWNQVGGNNLVISPIVRDSTSGTREVLDAAMASKLGTSTSDLSKNFNKYSTQGTTGAMLTQVNNARGSIGYVNLGSIPVVNTSVTTVISIDGVMPTQQTVLNGTYEISRSLILATIGEPTGEVAAFLTWIMSPQGQKIVEDNDFVPVKPTA